MEKSMKKSEFLLCIKEIKKLLKQKNKFTVKRLNLSGSGWQDYYTSNERAQIYREASLEEVDKAKEARYLKIRKDIKDLIITILTMLLQSGYSKDEILARFFTYDDKCDVEDYLKDILLQTKEASSEKKR